MKHMKKLASLLLALVMVMSLATTAFATSVTETTGTITITNAVVGQTYTIYRILELESYSTDADAYAYKATQNWTSFINGSGIKDTYVNVDAQGYVTWKEITNTTTGHEDDTEAELKAANDAAVAAFAKLAQAYAKTNSIAGEDNTTAAVSEGSTETTTTVTFSNLNLGYYLVDSTLGTLCSLDTTNPNVTIQEKNVAPTNEKKVQEDAKTGDASWVSENDADIGQTVNFKSTITAQAGAENYVFHDTMSAGLTFGGSVTVTLNGTTVDNTTVTNYTFTDYTASGATASTDGYTFEVKFTETFCNTLKADDTIVISYTATVNENATVGGGGNKNESWVSYGDNKTTTPASTTTTYTWSVNVFKYTEGEENDEGQKAEVALSGATFTLSKNSDGTIPIALIRVQDEGKDTNTYRVAKAGETDTVTEITTDATGKFTINGLDSDTYYLTETAAPAGYNKLAGPITVVIDSNGQTKVDSTVVNEVKVLNQTGAELPSTGGIGTTIFYVLGGILVVGAGVLLVTKKRMSDAR